jgi:hypothetical protein
MPLDRPSSELRARLLAATARAPATRPGTWRRRAIIAGALAIGWTLAAGAILGVRADWRELSALALGQTFVALLAVAALASAAGLTRGRSMVGAAIEPLMGAIWGGLTVLLVLVVAIDPQGPSTATFPARAILGRAILCDGLTLAIGLPLVALGRSVLGGLTLARPGLTGACLGLAAATWAHVVVRFHCAAGGSAHALVGHLLPALPLMAAGAWAARRDLRRGRAARLGAAREIAPAQKTP